MMLEWYDQAQRQTRLEGRGVSDSSVATALVIVGVAVGIALATGSLSALDVGLGDAGAIEWVIEAEHTSVAERGGRP